ncbi:hypothetical protein V8C37DRAFT_390474 [Trichoderma ceciliae]
MFHHSFTLLDDMVQHNVSSRAFTHDEDLIRAIPFIYDVVMPASVRMADATIRSGGGVGGSAHVAHVGSWPNYFLTFDFRYRVRMINSASSRTLWG